jgi:hypothetical protein
MANCPKERLAVFNCLRISLGNDPQHPDSPGASELLRARREWPRHCAPNYVDEIASPHAFPSLGTRPYSAFNQAASEHEISIGEIRSIVCFAPQQFRAAHVC